MATELSAVADDILLLVVVEEVIRPVAPDGNEAFADELPCFEIVDTLARGCAFLALAVMISSDPRRGLFPCGSLAGDRIFLVPAAAEDVRLGVPVVGALRVDVAANELPVRAVLDRNGEFAAFETGVLVMLLVRVLGVPCGLIL